MRVIQIVYNHVDINRTITHNRMQFNAYIYIYVFFKLILSLNIVFLILICGC